MNCIRNRILSCLITIGLLIICLCKLTDIMEYKSSDEKFIPFYKESNEYDVLFMGSSHVLNGVFPMELWRNYGITSYNFGGHNSHIPTTYWVMKNALDYSTPKLMVIDCFYLEQNIKTGENFSYMHMSFDHFPHSWNKIKAVDDLLDDQNFEQYILDNEFEDVNVEARSKIGLLWDFSVYHSRWEELEDADFNVISNVEKGAESRIGMVESEYKFPQNQYGKLKNETVGMQYLKRMIEECQEKNIEVLLTYLPFHADSINWDAANSVSDIAEQYQVNYINFLQEDVIDYNKDCVDVGHLNPSGAKKVTDYIGKYILNKYEIQDHRSDKEFSHWNEDYAYYKQKGK